MRYLLLPALLLLAALLASPASSPAEEATLIPSDPDEAPDPVARFADRQREDYRRLEGTIILRGDIVDAAGDPIDEVDVRIIRHTLDAPGGEPEEHQTADSRFVFRFDDVVSVYLQFTRGEHLISELNVFRALPEYAGLSQEMPQDFTTTVQLELVENTVELPEVLLLLSHLPDGTHFIHGIDTGTNRSGQRVPIFQSQQVAAEIHDLFPPFAAAGLERSDRAPEPLRDARGRAISPPHGVGRLHLDDGKGGGLIRHEPEDDRFSRHQVMRRMVEAPESGYQPSIGFSGEDYAYTDAMAPIYVWAKVLDFHAKGMIERVYYGPEGYHVLLRLRIQPDGSRHLATRD